MVAALANHTGGVVYLDATEGHSAEQAGAALAQAAHGIVFWPVSVELPPTMQEVLPKTIPPLRSDRDMVLLGTLKSRAPQAVKLVTEVNGRHTELQWAIAGEASSDDFSFLPQLVDGARDTGGVALPTLGSDGLRDVARTIATDDEALVRLGGSALRTGDLEGASKVAEAILRRDPDNPEALMIRHAAQHRAGAGKSGDAADLRLVKLQPVVTAPTGPAGPPTAGTTDFGSLQDVGGFLNLVQDNKQVIDQKFRAEVDQSLKDARQKLATDPSGTQSDLKLTLEMIDRNVDVSPDRKAQLREQVISAIKEASRRSKEVENRLAMARENLAASEERERLVAETARNQQKVKQLMDRFNSLIHEGRYQDAEDVVAQQVRELDPLGTTPETAIWDSRFGWNVSEMWRLREVRHRNFARALHTVEKALVPFPDEPPITYPEPQVWADLTLRRKKFASVELARKGNAEQKIAAALNDDTRLEFIETPLEDVVAFLRDQHGIPIEIDKKALDNVGVGTDTPVTRNLKGISLRSALRLILKDLGLTYIIRDEVLLITSSEEAEKELVTRVYPVGDLVIPITGGMPIDPFMMGGGMGGGMMGGMGGHGRRDDGRHGGRDDGGRDDGRRDDGRRDDGRHGWRDDGGHGRDDGGHGRDDARRR